ncbi:hypothetical protein [Cerasicoccus fimbriatus]|uniref:hypothetical protein n=1 Tax=Cerasicoccus fimbriatus TaxID=3014554 RepID=UPI0022B55392|nr:hypothetical protein [Cerasicoccus sp. TK19100]
MLTQKHILSNIKACVLSLAALCIISTTIVAQSPKTDANAPSSSMTPPIRALAVGFEDEQREYHILDQDNRSTGTIRLNLRGYTSEFMCPIVEGSIRFGLESGQDEDGNILYTPEVIVPWKTNYKKVCLVFIPKSFTGKKDLKQPYVVSFMDMSEEGFETGTTKVVNLAPVTAYVRFGEHQKAVETGRVVVIPKIEEVKRANMVQLSVYHMVDDAPHRVQETRVRYLDRIRYLIVLYPDFVNRRMGVASILDYGNLF